MADELTVDLKLSYRGATMSSAVTRQVVQALLSASGGHYQSGILTVTTSAIAIPLGSVTTAGYGYFKNLDDTNFIKIRAGSGGTDVVKIKPLESAVFRLASNSPYAIADTASCNLEYMIVED